MMAEDFITAYLQVSFELQKQLFTALKCIFRCMYMFYLQPKHDLKDNNQLLDLIQEFSEGIQAIDLKDKHPKCFEGITARLYSHSHLVRAAASDEASTSINLEFEVADTAVVAVEESPAEKQSFFYNKVEESAANRPSLSYEVKESAAEKETPK
ncbi:hypothetical protein Sjap_026326 [Stephania japonica]|uniref:Uncharacterized protein n=1 Tax=Stephania japonica TaxID=461633 RepID=A0AAP0E3B1_9MAGN